MAVVLKTVAKWYTGKLGARLSKLGLTYHDVVADTGVFDQGISRLPADLKVRFGVDGVGFLWAQLRRARRLGRRHGGRRTSTLACARCPHPTAGGATAPHEARAGPVVQARRDPRGAAGASSCVVSRRASA